MKITEWFATAVAAGLMPGKKNIQAFWGGVSEDTLYLHDPGDERIIFKHCSNIDKFDGFVQLRLNGKDFYSLEWRKPTEQDVGKMCWFLSEDNNTMFLTELTDVNVYEDLEDDSIYETFYQYETDDSCFDSQNCLLADHGQIAPTEADFKRIDGE